jgi:ABC-2 type transport system permease protein
MRQILAILRTDFRREFYSPAPLFFFLVLPLIFTASLVSRSSSGSTATESAIPLTVVQEDQDPLASRLVAALAKQKLAPTAGTSLPADGFGLVIPAGFSKQLRAGQPASLTLQVDGSDQRSPAVQQAVNAVQDELWSAVQVTNASVAEVEALGAVKGAAARQAFFDEFLDQLIAADETPLATAEVAWVEANTETDQATSAQQASAGQMVTWVQVTLLATSVVLVNERLWGTLRRLLMSPTSRAIILTGKMLFRLLLGLAQMTILFVSGALLFGVSWGNDPLAVAAVSVAFALAITGLGVLLATLVKTPGQANNASIGCAMILSALGGAWWPLEVTSPLYQQAVQFLPTTWAMRAYTDILVRGATLPEIIPAVTILLGFAVCFLSLGLWRFQRYS